MGNEKTGCTDNGITYPEGSEFCKDVYCIKCVDGTLELHPAIGAVTNLSEIW